MNVVNYETAPLYEAPGHSAMKMRRLQGREAGASDTVWLGLSEIAPGGGTTSTSSNVEKFYLVIEGRLDVIATDANGTEQRATLGPKDSCRIAPGEARRLVNNTGERVSVLLVMPNT